jgi:radical SAM protein with 4Fe4S-binding SPASM domain
MIVDNKNKPDRVRSSDDLPAIDAKREKEQCPTCPYKPAGGTQCAIARMTNRCLAI